MEEELKAIRGALLAIAPFFGSLLLKCSFKLDEDLPYPAANDGRKTIYINPKKFMDVSPKERIFVLAHEAGHLAFLSAQRRGNRNHLLWNIATDCVINYLLLTNRVGTEKINEIVTPRLISKITGVEEEKIEKMSADQIYNLLADRTDKLTGYVCAGCSHDEYAEDGGEDNGVKDEEDGGGKDESGAEEIEDYWKSAVAEAYNYAKSVGSLPAGEGIILRLLEPKINWRSLLRQAILQGPGLQVISTWKRPHRKIPGDVPGYTRLTVPAAWALVDTSGSMVGEHLNQVMTEVFSIAKSLTTRVNLVAWDTQAYEDTLENVKATLKVKGGGGTVITPALKLLLGKMRRNDIVVVLTDGLIHDIDREETQRLLGEAAAKSASAVFASTVVLPGLPGGWRKVLIA